MIEVRAENARLACILVILASVYLAVLCFMNTTFGNGARLIPVVDGAIVLVTLGLALRGQTPRLILPLLVIAANLVFLGLLRNSFDAKAMRDLLAPLAFLALGWRYGGIKAAKTTFAVIAALVILFGLYEYLLTSDYVRHFNVLQFYIDRGMVSARETQWVDGSLFISATRGARSLFAQLGQHRVASIFLEPVSLGNFGALAAAWALALDGRHKGAAWFAGAVAFFAIVAADARFGFMCVLFFFAARTLTPPRWTNAVVVVAPIAALLILFVMSVLNIGAGDDLPTRLATSGRALAAMSPAELFGVSATPLATQDSGYYYIFHSFGLVFSVFAWLAFAATPAPGQQSARFKLFLGIYMALLLCVSGTSLFALKTTALAFFLYGSLAAAEGFPRMVRAGESVRVPRSMAAV